MIKRFFDAFKISPLESSTCIKGANGKCLNGNIPKNCNNCEHWEAQVQQAYPVISSIRYMKLLKIALRWGCVFSQTEDGFVNVYDNDVPSQFELEIGTTIEEAILLGLIALLEQTTATESVQKEVWGVFNEVSQQKEW